MIGRWLKRNSAFPFTKEKLDAHYRYCLSLTNDRDEAFDVLQASVEKFLKSKTTPDHSDAYLRRIIRNQFIDNCRKLRPVSLELVSEDASTENAHLEENTISLENLIVDHFTVEKIWREINASDRELLYLWAVEGLTAQEVADEWSCPRGTVLSRIYRLREKIQRINGISEEGTQ